MLHVILQAPMFRFKIHHSVYVNPFSDVVHSSSKGVWDIDIRYRALICMAVKHTRCCSQFIPA